MTFHRPIKTYVWCDAHCSIHARERDVYDEGMKDCRPGNWRRVFVESKNPKEKFE